MPSRPMCMCGLSVCGKRRCCLYMLAGRLATMVPGKKELRAAANFTIAHRERNIHAFPGPSLTADLPSTPRAHLAPVRCHSQTQTLPHIHTTVPTTARRRYSAYNYASLPIVLCMTTAITSSPHSRPPRAAALPSQHTSPCARLSS